MPHRIIFLCLLGSVGLTGCVGFGRSSGTATAPTMIGEERGCACCPVDVGGEARPGGGGGAGSGSPTPVQEQPPCRKSRRAPHGGRQFS